MQRKLSLVPFDPEIEHTLRNRRKQVRFALSSNQETCSFSELSNSSTDFTDSVEHHSTMDLHHGEIPEAQPQANADNDTMSVRDMNGSTIGGAQRNTIEFDLGFELKSGLINAMPKFSGLAGEDAHGHIDRCSMVCGAMKPRNAAFDDVIKGVFPFTLEAGASQWLQTLPRHCRSMTWNELKEAFLDRYFPATKQSQLKKEITNVAQFHLEDLYEYWQRFQVLISKCPTHNLSKAMLIQYFYDGMRVEDQEKLDQSSGGSLLALTPNRAWEMIRTMANNCLQYNSRQRDVPRGAPSQSMDVLHKKVEDLSDAMLRLTTSHVPKSVSAINSSQALVPATCTICGSFLHHDATCPHKYEEVSAMYPNMPQGNYNPNRQFINNNTSSRSNFNSRGPYDYNSNTYHPDQRNHPNFRWRNDNEQPQGQMGGNPSTSTMRGNDLQGSSLEKRIGDLEKSRQQDNATIQAQLSQIMGALQSMQAQSSSLPSSTVPNPNSDRSKNVQQLNAISLRSGRKVTFEESKHEVGETSDAREGDELHQDDMVENEVEESEVEPAAIHVESESNKEKNLVTKSTPKVQSKVISSSDTSSKEASVKLSDLPFPHAYLRDKQVKNSMMQKETMDMFGKVEVNVPLIEFLSGNPKYLKYLKELCTLKKKCKPNEVVFVGSSVSSLFQSNVAVKAGDPGAFTIPCTLGNVSIPAALLDLGAAINVMPFSVFKSLSIKDQKQLKPTTMRIKLADQTIRKPYGVIEDFLVKVKDLVFPADFYVLDMANQGEETSLILGRPFMRTAGTAISLKSGCITMEVGDQLVTFNLYKSMQHPSEDYSLLNLNCMDVLLDSAVEDHIHMLHDETTLGVFDSDFMHFSHMPDMCDEPVFSACDALLDATYVPTAHTCANPDLESHLLGRSLFLDSTDTPELAREKIQFFQQFTQRWLAHKDAYIRETGDLSHNLKMMQPLSSHSPHPESMVVRSLEIQGLTPSAFQPPE